MPKPSLFDTDLVRSPRAVLLAWSAWAALCLIVQLHFDWEPESTDDWMRLLEVRALLDGQGWWDISQYRINDPAGFSMHWSRLVDLPLIIAFTSVGETAGMAFVPLLWLIPVLFALRSIMLRLNFAPFPFAIGLLAMPLFPLLPSVFVPFEIDHHGPQAALALITAALALSHRRMAAAGSGLAAAAWVVISLEGLPLIAVFAGLYGIRYWWAAQRLLPCFLGTLAAGTALLSLTTRPVSDFSAGYCDIVLPGHVLSFAIAAILSAAMPLGPGQRRSKGRFVALCVVGTAALVAGISALGPCAANPMASLDPILRTYWYDHVVEGLPVNRQSASVMVMLIMPLFIVGAGWWSAVRTGQTHDGRALAWFLLTVLALAASIFSLVVMRGAVIAQLLAIPFAAILLGTWLPKARAISSTVARFAATLAVIAMSTPIFTTAMAKPLDRYMPSAGSIAPLASGNCDYAGLAALRPGKMIAPLDAGPEILGKTSHTVVAAGYHRNQIPMNRVIAGFIGPANVMQRTARLLDVDYIVACLAAPDFAIYAQVQKDNLASEIVANRPPAWLEPAPDFASGALRVYRVRDPVRPGGNPTPHR
ncbi:hypothetical protein [Aurantiacibacter spongiae]|uniref:AcrB/AcrD/AcrF family protein n=1 Tax=Aurantiacibacter spongiae TaxID=2488860 RepID=A0A3N5CSA9_9SPHN|nr:hypothetical protein [Aurantiacibacter spongiae]RPF71467.1 hypothetical protein EG799_07440 [Aurantiacibacter spongiae]